jgi:HSP20 family protein
VNRIYFDRDLDGRSTEWLNDATHSRELGASYRPALDVVETDAGVEVIVDLAGVTADDVSVVFKAGTLVIAGQKRAPVCETRHAAFHLAERPFGAFTCVLRLSMAIDAGRARASFASGELRVTLPRIDDRRGAEVQIPIDYSNRPAR